MHSLSLIAILHFHQWRYGNQRPERVQPQGAAAPTLTLAHRGG